MQTTSDRIKQALKLRNLKQIDVVEITGINKGALSSYISGKYEPKQTNIYLLAKALDVNEAWLMGYDVPMNRENSIINISDLRTDHNNTSSQNDNNIIEIYYNKLNVKGKKEALKRIMELTYIPEYSNVTPDHLQVVAAHNDFADDEEQQRLMQEDLDDL